jgi:2',3'-cyclic-nucleotide 2'-phosphodiesterase/3'-nucleotidase
MNRLLTAFLVAMLLLSSVGISGAVAAETRNIVILGTSDIHGNVDNYDYFTDSVPTGSSQRGLTKLLTYINAVRAGNPNTILVDNGDTIQGTPLAYYFNMIDTSVDNPMAAAMNYMDYAAATVGNHEFNYGPAVLNRYQEEAEFPLLSANVTGCTDYTFQPYVIQDVNGVQVGILGLTPPAVTHWERPENIVGCVFGDAMTAANTYVPEMQALGADVIVVAAHTGLDGTYGYGREENFALNLANEVPGIDVILAGHAHANVPSQLVNGVLITEPNYHGRNISNIQITVTGEGSDWSVTAKSSTTPSMNTTPATIEDPGLYALMKPYHDAAVAYINTPIGFAEGAFPGGFQARIADGPMADLINQVQTEAAAEAGFPVQASLAALFTNDAKLNAGPIKLKDAYAVYIYDNTLYVIEATGQMIKDELEWTANYFNQYYYEPAGVTVNSAVRDYNYDLWSGIDYKLDVTKPVGQRVVELKLNGMPLAMDQVVPIALNNYRATGKFPTARILYQSTTEVRELVTNWIMAHSPIAPEDVYFHNFDLLPAISLWQSPTANVTRTDYANLLWTAFDGSTADYMKLPNEKKAGEMLTREGGLYLLGNRAMDGMWDIVPDLSLLQKYSDKSQLANWAKVSTAYALGAWIFVPDGNMLLPKELVTNAEALAWIREARYPYYTFLSTNDFHGQLETGKLVSSKLVGGAAFNMTYINNFKAINPQGTLLFDAGDIMQGTPISTLLKGESTIDVYNAMGYQAATMGNHEFDWGKTVLQARIAEAEFPMLLANVFNAGTDTRPDWMQPTAMFTVKGQQIGVIGVTSMYTPGIVMAEATAGLEFRDPAPVVSQLVAELRAAGADIVVLLAHMPDVYNNAVTQEMATLGIPGLDLIISGHSHSGYTGKVNGIPIIQAYSSGTAIGVSNLSYDRYHGGIVNSKLQVVTTYNEGVTPDPDIAALVDFYKAQVAPIVNAVKGSTLGTISRGPDRYTMEVPMGDLIADAQAWKGGTQIAFMNPGGIRADLIYTSYPHDITYGDLMTVQPFDNKLVTMTMTGSQIYAVLEQQFKPPQTSMKLLQVSGLKYSFDLSQPVGSRISGLTLTDGTPILPDGTTYTVALNEFIATGGDGFSVFLGGTNVFRPGFSDLDALVDYIQFRFGTPPGNTPIDPVVYPKIEGRITNITPVP